MAVLVTGGAGYVGSHTVARLVEVGEDVVVLDNLERGYRQAVRGAELVVGDIADPQVARAICARVEIDAVIHFAAYKAPGESMQEPLKYFRNNVSSTVTLLQSLLDKGLRHVVFSSSCSVYGTPSDLPVTEDAPSRPESPYGESKRMVEQILCWLDECMGVRYASLRYFNAAGAAIDASMGEDWSKTQNLVPLAVRAMLGRGPALRIFGSDYPTPDGTAIRDYVHVLDLADAHVRALQHLRDGDESAILNLGTGTGSSVLEVIRGLERVTGRKVPIEVVARRAGDPSALWADNALAKRRLGWVPQYDLTAILETAWRWHSRNPEGYAS
jgi:UDP-glucose-4-epimerase GalE